MTTQQAPALIRQIQDAKLLLDLGELFDPRLNDTLLLPDVQLCVDLCERTPDAQGLTYFLLAYRPLNSIAPDGILTLEYGCALNAADNFCDLGEQVPVFAVLNAIDVTIYAYASTGWRDSYTVAQKQVLWQDIADAMDRYDQLTYGVLRGLLFGNSIQ